MRHSRPLGSLVAILVLALVLPGALAAELLSSDNGFFVDLPEGFELRDQDHRTSYVFSSPDDQVEFDIVAYEAGRFPSAAATADYVAQRLQAKVERDEFTYQGRPSLFASLEFVRGTARERGLAVFIGPDKGRRTYTLLCFAEDSAFETVKDFILSCLDSFSVDRAALRAPGPLSQYLEAWPAERPDQKTVSFGPGLGNATADLPWSDAEEAQESDTAAREFRVLQDYAEVPTLAVAAWQRAYRMIYRESAPRLDRLALELDRLLPDDPTDAARKVLAWTQGFVYERDLEGMDFVPPLAAAYEGRGDCDSRAMVAAIVLERRGIDAILMVSSVYSHALLGVDVPGGGQRFRFQGKDYLVGETTAKVGLGMIAAEQADWRNWIGVQLGGP